MYRIFVFGLLVFLSSNTFAIAINCGDKKVTQLMADGYCPQPEQLAFRLENIDQWFCTKSNTGTSLILSAKAKGSLIRVLVDSPDNTCASVPHYTVVSYIMEL